MRDARQEMKKEISRRVLLRKVRPLFWGVWHIPQWRPERIGSSDIELGCAIG